MGKNNPKISIIIPNWNGKHFLKNCLESLKKQTFQDFETIIIDNGSSDGSVEYIKNYYPEVIIEQFSENKGFSIAINKGIELSNGNYIFLLNNDTEVEKRCLQVLNRILDKRKDIGFCATKMLYFYDRNKINDCGDVFSIYGIAHQGGKGENNGWKYNKEELVFGACAGAAIYQKEVFNKIGTLDDIFFAYLEDIDLSFRAQLFGFKCLYIPEAIVYHIDGGTSKKIDNFSRFLTLRNSLYVITKNLPFLLIVILLPFLIIGQLRNIFMGIKHKCLKLIFFVYKDFFKNFQSLLKKRKYIQNNKKVGTFYILKILSKKYPFSILKSF